MNDVWLVIVTSAAGSYCCGVVRSQKEAMDLAAAHRRATPFVATRIERRQQR